MRIDYLREFIEVAYCLNFSKAADNLGVSQSSVSKHIQALEKHYGIDLLERDTASVALTPFGVALFQEAMGLVETADRFDATMADLAERFKRSIVAAGMHYNPKVARLFKAAQTSLSDQGLETPVYCKTALNEPVIPGMAKGAFDLAVTPELPEYADKDTYFVLALWDEPLCAVMSKGHPLATSSAVALADIANYTLIRPSGSYAILGNSFIVDLFARKGIALSHRALFTKTIHDLLDADFSDDELTLVEAGVGNETLSRTDLCTVPVSDPDAVFHLVACCLRRNKPAVRFIEAIAAQLHHTPANPADNSAAVS